jgi:GTP-dependent phosphoenolpyruvate carboxykinase
MDGLRVARRVQETLFAYKPEEWREEIKEVKKFLEPFGRHIPHEIRENYEKLESALK